MLVCPGFRKTTQKLLSIISRSDAENEKGVSLELEVQRVFIYTRIYRLTVNSEHFRITASCACILSCHCIAEITFKNSPLKAEAYKSISVQSMH